MGSSKTITLKKCNIELSELVEKTFLNLRWRYKKLGDNHYKASIGMGLKSNGENFTVVLNDETLFMESKLKFGLVDWGKNRKNIEIFERTLEKIRGQFQLVEINDSLNADSFNHEEFVDKIKKINKLFLAEILTPDEFASKKIDIINSLKEFGNIKNIDDFLISLITLKNNNILTQEEILTIKKEITDEQ